MAGTAQHETVAATARDIPTTKDAELDTFIRDVESDFRTKSLGQTLRMGRHRETLHNLVGQGVSFEAISTALDQRFFGNSRVRMDLTPEFIEHIATALPKPRRVRSPSFTGGRKTASTGNAEPVEGRKGASGRIVTFGPTLRRLREQSGKTLDEVAASIGSSSVTVRRWEDAKSEPSLDRLAKLAALFGVTTDQLLGFAEGSITRTGGTTS